MYLKVNCTDLDFTCAVQIDLITALHTCGKCYNLKLFINIIRSTHTPNSLGKQMMSFLLTQKEVLIDVILKILGMC